MSPFHPLLPHCRTCAALVSVVIVALLVAVPVAPIGAAQDATPGPAASPAAGAGITSEAWGEVDGEQVSLFTLSNANGMEVKLTN
jgi:hypothetical protein